MKVIARILIVILQLLFAGIFGFAPVVLFHARNGWELIIFITGLSLGVWGIGLLTESVARTLAWRPQLIRLAGTVLLTTLGVVLILVTPTTGLIRIFYPLVGAFLGYYLAPLVHLKPQVPQEP